MFHTFNLVKISVIKKSLTYDSVFFNKSTLVSFFLLKASAHALKTFYFEAIFKSIFLSLDASYMYFRNLKLIQSKRYKLKKED